MVLAIYPDASWSPGQQGPGRSRRRGRGHHRERLPRSRDGKRPKSGGHHHCVPEAQGPSPLWEPGGGTGVRAAQDQKPSQPTLSHGSFKEAKKSASTRWWSSAPLLNVPSPLSCRVSMFRDSPCFLRGRLLQGPWDMGQRTLLGREENKQIHKLGSPQLPSALGLGSVQPAGQSLSDQGAVRVRQQRQEHGAGCEVSVCDPFSMSQGSRLTVWSRMPRSCLTDLHHWLQADVSTASLRPVLKGAAMEPVLREPLSPAALSPPALPLLWALKVRRAKESQASPRCDGAAAHGAQGQSTQPLSTAPASIALGSSSLPCTGLQG